MSTTVFVIICCGYALKLKLTVPISSSTSGRIVLCTREDVHTVRCEAGNSTAGKRGLHRVVRNYRSCRVEVLRMGTRIVGKGANELRKGGGRLGARTK
jgi:hypothetical protein